MDIFLNDDDITITFGTANSHKKKTENILWKKVNGKVIVPFGIPKTASKRAKAQLALVISEFDSKTCIR